MILTPCTEYTSILEADLLTAAGHGNVRSIQIVEVLDVAGRAVESGAAYYLIVRMKSSRRRWYLTTRRDRSAPRLYRDLRRLRSYLAEHLADVLIEMAFDKSLPPLAKKNC